MTITDVLLVVTIILLLAITVLNVTVKDSGQCPRPCPTYMPRPCEGFENPFAAIEANEEMFLGSSYGELGVDEMVNYPAKRGLLPSMRQPQHTANLWKSAYSQPTADDMGMRHTYFSSDLLTPYKNEYNLRRVNPAHVEPRTPHVGDTMYEKFTDGPCDNPISYRR